MKGTGFHRVIRGWRRLEARVMKGSVVLLYHRVARRPHDPFGLCVEEKHFEEHLEVVHRVCGQPPVRLQDLFSTGACRVAITFDDGYEDNLRCALPILERHGAPAAFFLTSATPGQPYWWDVLAAASLDDVERLLRGSGTREASSGHMREGERRRNAHRLLISMSGEDRRTLVGVLKATLSEHGVLLPRSLNEREVQTLGASPLAEIGAHTHSHVDLGRASDPCRSREIMTNLEYLTEWTGKPPASFAFPYGTFPSAPARLSSALLEAGFERACLAEPGVVRSSTNPLRIPRLWVHDQDGEQLERLLRPLLG